MPWRRIGGCVLAFFLAGVDIAWGGVIRKINKKGDQLIVRLAPEEAEGLEPGVKVILEIFKDDKIRGEVLKISGAVARIKLEKADKEIKAKMDFKIYLNTQEAVAENAGSVRAYPAGVNVIVHRYSYNPYSSYIPDGVSSTDSGSGTLTNAELLTLNTRAKFHFVIGRLQIGPELAYFSQTNKVNRKEETEVSGATTSSAETETDLDVTFSAFELGLSFRYCFSDYAPQAVIPFSNFDFGIGQASIKVGEDDPSTGETQYFGLGFGVQYFMTAVFVGEVGLIYRQDTVQSKSASTTGVGSDTTTTTTTTSKQTLTTTGFLYGIGFYF